MKKKLVKTSWRRKSIQIKPVKRWGLGVWKKNWQKDENFQKWSKFPKTAKKNKYQIFPKILVKINYRKTCGKYGDNLKNVLQLISQNINIMIKSNMFRIFSKFEERRKKKFCPKI